MQNYGEPRQSGIGKTFLNYMFYNLTKQQKDKEAIVSGEESISYKKLAREVERKAIYYQKKNATRIALYLPNSIRFCIQFLTAFLHLEVVFIFSILWDESEVLKICKENDINILVKIDEVIQVFEGKSKKRFSKVAVVLYTSGTTNNPKGVMLTRENLYTNALAAINSLKYTNYDKILVTKPLYHSYGLTIEFLAGILSGATIFLYSGIFLARRVEKLFRDLNITVWCSTPTLLFNYVENALKKKNSLRIVAVGGARSSVKLLMRVREFFDEVQLVQLYGLTEAGPLVTCSSIDHESIITNAIGFPVKGVCVEVRDQDDTLISEPGVVGELVVMSKGIMKGYLNDDKATKSSLRNGKLYTGDTGYFDHEKRLFYCDRTDSLISRGGINVYCSEIEATIEDLKYVEEVAVIGIENDVYSQSPVAFIKCSEILSEKDIFMHCKKNNVQPPDKIIFVESIPKNSIGKIDTKLLKNFVQL